MLEVFADVSCPFTHVGLRAALAERARQGRDDVTLRVHAWPLELVNGAATDPTTTAAHVAALRAQVASDLFSGFIAENVPSTTMLALALEAAAYRVDPATGEAVSLALRDALFEQGLDISSAVVLRTIAARWSLSDVVLRDDAPVLAEWRAGQARGVLGSPHFFCADIDVFCPALDIARDAAGSLTLRRNAAQLREFLGGCFAR